MLLCFLKYYNTCTHIHIEKIYIHKVISVNMSSLSTAYSNLQSTQDLPEDLWDEWLWKTDPDEPYAADVLMNRCQLLGFLVCLFKGMQQVSNTDQALTDPDTARLTLMSKPIHTMSLRELKDTIENLQVEWPCFLKGLDQNRNAQRNLSSVVTLLDQCFARFGALCLVAAPQSVMDDLGSVDPYKPEPGLFRISTACIRRTVCTFMVFYRHIHLLAVARHVVNAPCDCGISKYHMEASGDEFNLLCMHLSLPVAAKMNYKHDFPEMYNHVSQVVFFHNSEYQRTPRAKLEALESAEPEHILPALMQLHPTIAIKYEEDRVDLSVGASGSDWWWLVVAGRIYLVDPEREVWYSPSVTSLLKNVYLKCKSANTT